MKVLREISRLGRATFRADPAARFDAISNNLPSRDSLDEISICFKEVIQRQVATGHPGDLLENPVLDFIPIRPDQKEDYLDVSIGIAMTQAKDLLAHVNVDRKFFCQLPSQGSFQVFSVSNFSARKFPLQGVSVRSTALADQYFVPVQ